MHTCIDSCIDPEDLIICLVLYIGLAIRLDVILSCFPAVPITPQERRSARACAVQTRFRLSQFCTFFGKIRFFFCARALLLSAQAWHLRISLKTRSAYACAVQTRFRPSILGVFFNLFSLRCPGLLRFGPALLRLGHAWPFSARTAIRLRLCGSNTHSSHHLFCFF